MVDIIRLSKICIKTYPRPAVKTAGWGYLLSVVIYFIFYLNGSISVFSSMLHKNSASRFMLFSTSLKAHISLGECI